MHCKGEPLLQTKFKALQRRRHDHRPNSMHCKEEDTITDQTQGIAKKKTQSQTKPKALQRRRHNHRPNSRHCKEEDTITDQT